MVSSLLADALADPTAVLQVLFDPNEPIDAFPSKVSTYFENIFNSHLALQEIPPLNVQNPPEAYKDRSLVRFRAMIQDTSPSPEIYLAKHTGDRCGGWGLAGDHITQQDDIHRENPNHANLRECTVLWAVNIPGENSWYAAALDPDPPIRKYANYKPPCPHKFPFPNTLHIGTQVKVYGSTRTTESLKSTDLFTFVGILTVEPLKEDLEFASPTLVPTLHVLFSQPILPTLVPRIYEPSSPNSMDNLRDELIAWIANECLAGDHSVAEWALLCAIARVQSRTPPILSLSLTISRFPSSPAPDQNITPSLSHVLSQILPFSTTIDLTLDTLNTTYFAPESKNEDLHSGWLQLPSGSVCVLAEGGLTEGGVSERGIDNLRAIQKIMSTQTLEYVFPYSRFTFNTDIALIVLSNGGKSTFFQTSVNVPLQPTKAKENFDFYKPAKDIAVPSQEKLNMFRRLVGGAKVRNVTISEETAKFIQDDFVNIRKTTTENFTPDDLIHLMTIARWLAFSLHEQDLSVAIWERAKALETQRRARI